MIIRDQRVTGAITLAIVAAQLYTHPGLDIVAAVSSVLTVVASIVNLITLAPGTTHPEDKP